MSLSPRPGIPLFPALEDPRFSAHAVLVGPDIVVRLSGSADTNVKAELGTFLGAVHAEAITRNVKDVHVDFQALDFINPSCLKDFFGWILKLEESTPEEQYRLHFHANPRKAWQHRCLHTLASLAQDLVVIS